MKFNMSVNMFCRAEGFSYRLVLSELGSFNNLALTNKQKIKVDKGQQMEFLVRSTFSLKYL